MKLNLSLYSGLVKKLSAAKWLLSILLMASGFRLWRLASLPHGLQAEEVSSGLVGLKILEGNWQLTGLMVSPWEAFWAYLHVPSLWLLGNTTLALRIIPALAGVGTVYLTYLWTKRWWDKRVALLTAGWMAMGSWAVFITRLNVAVTLVPLIIALNIWLITKYIDSKNWYWASLSGLSLAVGFYCHYSYAFVLLAGLVVMLFAGLRRLLNAKFLFKPLAIGLLSALIGLLPLAIYWQQHPEQPVSALNSNNYIDLGGRPVINLAKATAETSLMFNYEGDDSWQRNLAGAPLLEGSIGLLAVFGLMLGIRRFKDIRYFSLLAILAASLMPTILQTPSAPNALLSAGTVAVIYVLAALGLNELIRRFLGVFPRNIFAKGFLYVVVGTTLTVTAAYSYQRYFVAWANAPEAIAATDEAAPALSKQLRSDPNSSYYLVLNASQAPQVSYLSYDSDNYQLLNPEQLGGLVLGPDTKLIVSESIYTEAQPHLQSLLSQVKLDEEKTLSTQRANVTLYRTYAKTN